MLCKKLCVEIVKGAYDTVLDTVAYDSFKELYAVGVSNFLMHDGMILDIKSVYLKSDLYLRI